MPNLNLWLGICICWPSNDGELAHQSTASALNGQTVLSEAVIHNETTF